MLRAKKISRIQNGLECGYLYMPYDRLWEETRESGVRTALFPDKPVKKRWRKKNAEIPPGPSDFYNLLLFLSWLLHLGPFGQGKMELSKIIL